jgi:hypothetical protein
MASVCIIKFAVYTLETKCGHVCKLAAAAMCDKLLFMQVHYKHSQQQSEKAAMPISSPCKVGLIALMNRNMIKGD